MSDNRNFWSGAEGGRYFSVQYLNLCLILLISVQHLFLCLCWACCHETGASLSIKERTSEGLTALAPLLRLPTNALSHAPTPLTPPEITEASSFEPFFCGGLNWLCFQAPGPQLSLILVPWLALHLPNICWYLSSLAVFFLSLYLWGFIY